MADISQAELAEMQIGAIPAPPKNSLSRPRLELPKRVPECVKVAFQKPAPPTLHFCPGCGHDLSAYLQTGGDAPRQMIEMPSLTDRRDYRKIKAEYKEGLTEMPQDEAEPTPPMPNTIPGSGEYGNGTVFIGDGASEGIADGAKFLET